MKIRRRHCTKCRSVKILEDKEGWTCKRCGFTHHKTEEEITKEIPYQNPNMKRWSM
jgi:ribosomal protein S27AE